MAEINVTWVNGRQFIGTDSTNHSVVLSGSDNRTGMKPSELLLVSLASCTAYDVVQILEKRRVKLTDVQVSVSGEQLPDPPWTFIRMHIHYSVSGVDLSEEEVARAIKLSKEKYCSVSATLAQSVDITYDYEVLNEAVLA